MNRRRRIQAVYLIPLFSILTACATTYDSRGLGQDFEPSYMSLSGNPVLIEIVDARQDTTSQSLSVPFMSFPGISDNSVEPAVTRGHYRFIQSELRKHFAGGDPLEIYVQIQVGVQRFTALTMSEKVEAEFALSVRIVRNGQTLGGRVFLGEAMMGIEEFDTNSDRAEDIYLMVIVASIEMSMRTFLAEIEA